MLLNNLHTKVFDTEGSNLLIIDPTSKNIDKISVPECDHVTLSPLFDDKFLCFKNFYDYKKLIISICPFDSPSDTLSSVTVTAESLDFSGDSSLWEMVPRYFIEYLDYKQGKKDYRLIDLKTVPDSGFFPVPPWYDDKSFDKGHSPICSILQMPNSTFLLFSVKKHPSLILYDPNKQTVVKEIKLDNGSGLPSLVLSNDQSEMWSDDYDTLLKFSIPDFKVLNSIQLQATESYTIQGHTFPYKKFIGDFSLSPDEKYCAVARPYSNDVVLLDTETFKIISTSKSQKQPLTVALLPNLEYVCRDWKTGDIEFGRFDL